MSALKLVPAIEENFFKDRCFADQRVAGANPYQLWRVTNKEGKSTLRKNVKIHFFSVTLRKGDNAKTGIRIFFFVEMTAFISVVNYTESKAKAGRLQSEQL